MSESSEPVPFRHASERGDVRLLLVGLGLGTLLGSLLIGVLWLAIGNLVPQPREASTTDTALREERDLLQRKVNELENRPPPPLNEKESKEGEEIRDLQRAKKALEQDCDQKSKELVSVKGENSQLEQKLKKAEKELADERGKLADAKPAKVSPSPPPPVKELEVLVAGPVVPAGREGVRLTTIAAGEVLTPVGVPHPAQANTTSPPYVVQLNKQTLVRVEPNGNAYSRLEEVKPFPHIWCGLVAVRSKNNPSQKPRYYRAYNPPRVELPPLVGAGRWELSIGSSVRSEDIADLRHYLEHKGELALGAKGAVAIDNGTVRALTPAPDAPEGVPPSRLVDGKADVTLELKDGVLIVTSTRAADKLCEIVELEVVRPVRDIPELKSRGVTVFFVRKK